jgi:hypothetical protein
VQLPARNDPDRLLGHEEAFVRALIEQPKITYAQAWAIARGLPIERATKGMRSAASQAMQRPRVQKYLAEQRAAVSAKAKEEIACDRVAVLRDLLEIKNRCMEAVPVFNARGEPIGEWTFNSAGALRALELIGRELGMFVDRKEVRHGPLLNVTDEELDTILAESAAQAGIGIVRHVGRDK